MHKLYCIKCGKTKEAHEFSNKGVIINRKTGKRHNVCDHCCNQPIRVRTDLTAYWDGAENIRAYFPAKKEAK